MACFYLKFLAIRCSSEAAMSRFGPLSTWGHPFSELFSLAIANTLAVKEVAALILAAQLRLRKLC